MSGIKKFIKACNNGDEAEVKRLAGQDPILLNKQDQGGWTGLMEALYDLHYSISRWLLGQIGLDTAVSNDDNRTALHFACRIAPLDIVVRLAELSSKQTIDQQDRWGDTALDMAVRWPGGAIRAPTPSAADLYLSWLGAACKYNRADPVAVHSWIQAGRTKDAQLWALAAKDIEALNVLARIR